MKLDTWRDSETCGWTIADRNVCATLSKAKLASPFIKPFGGYQQRGTGFPTRGATTGKSVLLCLGQGLEGEALPNRPNDWRCLRLAEVSPCESGLKMEGEVACLAVLSAVVLFTSVIRVKYLG